VLRRLREFYRGEVARLEPTDPVTVCTRVGSVLQDRMRRGAAEFELRAPHSLPRVMVDRTRLEIVLHNLLTDSLDAFEALPPQGVQPRRIAMTAETHGTDVLIAVDAGPEWQHYTGTIAASVATQRAFVSATR
jgi:C4-dicarboxylate-specific signal transduction histidine kinase